MSTEWHSQHKLPIDCPCQLSALKTSRKTKPAAAPEDELTKNNFKTSMKHDRNAFSTLAEMRETQISPRSFNHKIESASEARTASRDH